MIFKREILFETFCKIFEKCVAWPMHCYLSLFYCFTTLISLVVGAQNTNSTLNNAQNSFKKQYFENGNFFCLFS